MVTTFFWYASCNIVLVSYAIIKPKNKPEADIPKDVDAMKYKLVGYVKPNVRFHSNSFLGPYGLNAFVFYSRHAKKQKY
jgi:hypothetical protein